MLSTTPAWPFMPAPPHVARIEPIAEHLSQDGRVRVHEMPHGIFVSVDGDSFSGPHKTREVAQAYGDRLTCGTLTKTWSEQ